MKKITKKSHIFISILVILAVVSVFLWYVQKNKTTVISGTDRQPNIQIPDSSTTLEEEKGRDDVTNEPEQEKSSNIVLYNSDGTIDTSNWQTYRNEEYGFEVSYPDGFSLHEKYVEDDIPNVTLEEYFYILINNIQNGTHICTAASISVRDLPKENMTIAELLDADDRYGKDGLRRDYFDDTSYESSINNLTYLISEKMPDSLIAVTLKKDRYYIISMRDDIGGASITDNCRNIYFKILDSFRLF